MCLLEPAQDELTVHWEALVLEGQLSLWLEIGRDGDSDLRISQISDFLDYCLAETPGDF